MGKDTDDRNIALTAVLLSRNKEKQEKYLNDEMTGPFQLQSDKPIVASEKNIKSSIPTFGALAFIAALAFGAYQAVVSLGDRIEHNIKSAIESHSKDTTAHSDLRKAIDRNQQAIETKHREILDRMDKMLDALSRRKRR